jgi:hypothetical protein
MFDEALDSQGGPKEPSPGARRQWLRTRIRPWVVGAALIAFGVCCHIAVKADPLPGRIEQGGFAYFEFLVFVAGLGLVRRSLSPRVRDGDQSPAWFLWWWVAALAALWIVIDNMPS